MRISYIIIIMIIYFYKKIETLYELYKKKVNKFEHNK